MRKLTTAFLALGFGGMLIPAAQAADEQEGIRDVMRKFRINATRAEVGLSAASLGSSDYLHAPPTSSTGNALIGTSTSSAAVTSGAGSGATAAAAASADGGGSDAAVTSTTAQYDDGGSTPAPAADTSSSSGGGSPAPSSGGGYTGSAGGYTGGKAVVDYGKDPLPPVVMPDPAPLFHIAVDAGYQSRYYHYGINRVFNSGFQFGENAITEDATDVYYGGIAASFYGFSAGIKYVRGTEDFETRFSIDPIVVTTYEEWVYHANYTLAVLPDGHLGVTVGYMGITIPEDTFYNTDRFDDFYVRVGNASIPYFRPSVSYHYLDGADPLTTGTIAPGVQIHDGELIIAKVDGQLNLPGHLGVPFDVAYYAEFGFDDELNNHDGNGFDHDWTQVGVSLPIYVGNVTISPYWAWNDRPASSLTGGGFIPADDEHFWGVNVRFDF